jgi:ribonuclease P/MRP protein subunit RPP40
VNHRLLLKKLDYMGVQPGLRTWIRDFLHRRSFRVKVGNTVSDSKFAISGVPQGSVLGPLLFLIFIDDLVRSLNNPVFAFADDIKIIGSQGRTGLIGDIQLVQQWSVEWDLPLNLQKSHVLTRELEFSLSADGQDTLGVVDSTRDLGVIVAADFKPSLQCVAAAKKARAELFRLRRVLSSRSPTVFLPLYTAIVRPHLEYCVQAWSPYFKKDIRCLERVQRLATRMMVGMKSLSYKSRLSVLDLFSLERRRARGDLIVTFKILHGIMRIDRNQLFILAPSSGTRGHPLKLRKSHARLNTRANFFAHRVINMWNRLPSELVASTSVDAFKSKLDEAWLTLFPGFL